MSFAPAEVWRGRGRQRKTGGVTHRMSEAECIALAAEVLLDVKDELAADV